jgi:hypothetical protein
VFLRRQRRTKDLARLCGWAFLQSSSAISRSKVNLSKRVLEKPIQEDETHSAESNKILSLVMNTTLDSDLGQGGHSFVSGLTNLVLSLKKHETKKMLCPHEQIPSLR